MSGAYIFVNKNLCYYSENIYYYEDHKRCDFVEYDTGFQLQSVTYNCTSIFSKTVHSFYNRGKLMVWAVELDK